MTATQVFSYPFRVKDQGQFISNHQYLLLTDLLLTDLTFSKISIWPLPRISDIKVKPSRKNQVLVAPKVMTSFSRSFIVLFPLGENNVRMIEWWSDKYCAYIMGNLTVQQENTFYFTRYHSSAHWFVQNRFPSYHFI